MNFRSPTFFVRYSNYLWSLCNSLKEQWLSRLSLRMHGLHSIPVGNGTLEQWNLFGGIFQTWRHKPLCRCMLSPSFNVAPPTMALIMTCNTVVMSITKFNYVGCVVNLSMIDMCVFLCTRMCWCMLWIKGLPSFMNETTPSTALGVIRTALRVVLFLFWILDFPMQFPSQYLTPLSSYEKWAAK